jgi:hypothetical protein
MDHVCANHTDGNAAQDGCALSGHNDGNLRRYPGESALDFELQKWMGLIAQFATAEEASTFVPSLCKYRNICPHVLKSNRERPTASPNPR